MPSFVGLDVAPAEEICGAACTRTVGAVDLEEVPDSMSVVAELEVADGGAERAGVEAHLDVAEPLVDGALLPCPLEDL